MEHIFPIFQPVPGTLADTSWSNVLRWVLPTSNPSPQVVISTSLYHGTHQPVKYSLKPPTKENIDQPRPWIKGCRSWRATYFEPFLDGCRQKLPKGWIHRVYLARNLQFLIPEIPPRVQIAVMRENSWGSVPGMFWRYLPLEQKVFCMARGADNYRLDDQSLNLTAETITNDVFLIRRIARIWRRNEKLIYRGVHGSCGVQGPLPLVQAASQWIQATQEGLISDEIQAFPDMRHHGLSHWSTYGQDEQFLCRWLYYLGANRKTIGLHFKRTDPDIFPLDQAYYEQKAGDHRYVVIDNPAKYTIT